MANTEGEGHKDGGYGLGWVVIPEKQDFGSCYHQYIHTYIHLYLTMQVRGIGKTEVLM